MGVGGHRADHRRRRVLRFLHVGQVPPDPFYDAAVRSMSLSWHNFFFGVFEPGGSVSIDKPPVDLWLQVASVKLLGFSTTNLKLPEAIAGTAAVPLLWAAVRRMWSPPAAIAAALAIAVLPVEVITSRSDTMDAVMMALIVLALLLVVRAGESGSSAWLFAAAAALGLAFDVKLLESLVALPGLALLAYLAMPGSRRLRLLSWRAPARYTWRWRSRGSRPRCWCPLTTGPTRSARPTAAPGTLRSCSTAPTASAANRPNRRRPSMNPGTVIRWRPSPSAITSRSCPLRHAPARPRRASVGRATGARAAGRAAAWDPGADQRRVAASQATGPRRGGPPGSHVGENARTASRRTAHTAGRGGGALAVAARPGSCCSAT